MASRLAVRLASGWTAVAALAAACCASVVVGGGEPWHLPGPLHRLTLLEEHPRISPVVFDHALHVDPGAMGREVECSGCHHTLRERPADVPAPCTSCHGFAHERPAVDETAPHDHATPPDL